MILWYNGRMPGFPESKWDKLNKELQDEILQFAKDNSAFIAGKTYAEKSGMRWDSLYQRLRKMLKKEGLADETNQGGYHSFSEEGLARHIAASEAMRSDKKKPKELNKEEKHFLDRLEKGEASLSDASRFVAVRVFKRMLEHPDDIKFIDFFRTELLKLKSEENKIKDNWSKEIVMRMFAGKLPPQLCPHCGGRIVAEAVVVEGRDESNEQLVLE